MRRCFLTIAFIVLSGALWTLWQARYERVPGFPILTLEDVRKSAVPVPGIEWSGDGPDTVVKVRLPPGQRKMAARFGLPIFGPIDMLHVKLRMKAWGLSRGNEKWEEGRVMMEWWSPDGKQRRKMDLVEPVRDDDQLDLRGMVIENGGEPGMLSLRLEHLGTAGFYEVSGMEVSNVREKMLWSGARWILAALWGAWIYLLIRSWPEIPKWRALLASAIGLVIAMQLVVPGPWKAPRSMAGEFWLGRGEFLTQPAPADSAVPPAGMSGEVAPEGELPHQGSFILQVKLALAAIRPLLHMLLLLGPALLMFCLVGRRPGLLLMVMLALGVELAQYLFGYGFDGADVWDLANDAIGIGSAVAVHSLIGRRLGSRVMWWPAKGRG